MDTPDVIQYRLARIETREFSVHKVPSDILNSNFGYSLNFNVQGHLEEEVLEAQCEVEYSIVETKSPFLKCSISCFLKVEGLAKWVMPHNKLELPPGFLRILFMVGFGTLRGVLHTRTEGTALNLIMLPVLDPMEFVPDAPAPSQNV